MSCRLSLLAVSLIKLAAAGAAVLHIVGCSESSRSINPRPNVVLIAVDDLNDWVGAMGHPDAKTPNMDRLAARGTIFLNAHVQAPICGPSRASLMSGLRPSSTGIYGFTDDEDLRQASPALATIEFLPEYFGNRGYETLGIGKLFHQHAPQGVFEVSGGREPGFGPAPPERIHWDREGTSTDWGPYPATDDEMPDYRSAQWAVERLAEPRENPLFLAVGFLRPHVPWHVPRPWFDMYSVDSLALPPYQAGDMDDVPSIGHSVADVPMMPTTEWAIREQQWGAIVQAYLASVSFVDAQVGKVLDAIEQNGLTETTTVILFSDHGYHLGEKNRFAKHSLWERATRVPLIIAGPGVPAAQQIAAPVELLDIYPTLVELASLPDNGVLEGRSLVPLLSDPSADWPYVAVTTYGRNNHAVRGNRWRLISYEDGSLELYDHRTDPNEFNNVAALTDNSDQVDRLRSHIPKTNVPWSELSEIDVLPYFEQQRARSLEAQDQVPTGGG